MKKMLAAVTLLALILMFGGCTKAEPNSDAEAHTEPPAVQTPQQSPAPVGTTDSTPSPTEPSAVYYDRGYVPAADPTEEGMSAPEGMLPLRELPSDYTLEQAESDGCVVYSGVDRTTDILAFGEFRFLSGEETFNTFKDKVRSGENACVRIFREYPVISVYPPVCISEVYDLEHRDGAFITRRWIIDDTAGIEYEKKCTYTYPSGEDALVACYNNDPALAAADGCPVMLSESFAVSEYTKSIISGLEIWNGFLEKSNSGQSASIRIGNLYPTQGAASGSVKYPDENTEFSLAVFEVEYDGREYTYRYFDPETGMVTAQEYPFLVKLSKAPTAPDGVYALMYTDSFDLNEINKMHSSIDPLSYKPETVYVFSLPRGTE